MRSAWDAARLPGGRAACLALTAKTYAEVRRCSRRRASLSFARHAFNDSTSFFAGWALSLDYILTIAISAYFVPFYASALPGLRDQLGPQPGQHHRARTIASPARGARWSSISAVSASPRRSISSSPVTGLATQIARGDPRRAGPRARRSRCWSIRCTWGWRRVFSPRLVFALSIAMLAYTGIETVSNMAEEAQDPGHDVPKAVNLVLFAVLGVYMGISVVALSALPVTRPPPASTVTLLAGDPARARAATEAELVLEHRRPLQVCSGAVLPHRGAQYYVGLLATTILFIATNAGNTSIGISRLSWSLSEHRQATPSIFSRLHPTYRTPVVHDHLLLGLRRPADHLRQHQCARQPVLVRRHALFHDGARRDRRVAGDQGPRPRAALPDARQRPDPRLLDPGSPAVVTAASAYVPGLGGGPASAP